MKHIWEIIVIAYLLGIFPLLLGSGLIVGKKKNICKAYLYGYVLQICAFMCLCLVEMQMGCSLFTLTKSWKIIILVATLVLPAWKIYRKKWLTVKRWLTDTVQAMKPYIWHYLVLFLVVCVLTLFQKDASRGDDVKQILDWYYQASLPQSGSPYAVFYAMLAVFSGMHPTVIVKWIMPFIHSFCSLTAYYNLFAYIGKNGIWGQKEGEKSREQKMMNRKILWIFLWIILWMVPFTNAGFVFGICCPLLFYLGLRNAKCVNGSLRFLMGMVIASAILAFPRNLLHKMDVLLPVALLVIAVLAVVLLWILQNGRKKPKEKEKSILFTVLLTALLVSIIVKGYTVFSNGVAIPDNRYKVDADIMQIRMMLEPFEYVKMLAPLEVMDQITDIDKKVDVLFDSANDSEIGADLEWAGYDDIKLLQHGLGFECNVVVAYAGDDRLAQDALFEEYDYRLLAECGRYVVYQYVPGLGEYVVTQYASESGNQAMIYTITDWENHLIIIDGGWRVDAPRLLDIIMQHGGHVDAWILTHPHPDHIGAFNELLETNAVEVDRIYAAPVDYDIYKSMANWWDGFEEYDRFLELTADMDSVTYVRENDQYDLFGLTMDVYYSFNEEELAKAGSTDPCNDGGIVFKLSGQEDSMIFLADVGALLSDYIISGHGENLKADYVQMGHHGYGGSSEKLLSLIQPSVAFFDCPQTIVENPDYHVDEKMELMQTLGAKMYFYKDAPASVKIE